MAQPTARIAKRAAQRLPNPLLRWTARLAARLLLPLAGAAAATVVHRARWRLGSRRSPDGTVVVEINRDLRALAPDSGDPVEPLAVLAERAHLTLAGVPGRSVTSLRAVPRHAGDDIRRAVTLAKQRLEAEEPPRLTRP